MNKEKKKYGGINKNVNMNEPTEQPYRGALEVPEEVRRRGVDREGWRKKEQWESTLNL